VLPHCGHTLRDLQACLETKEIELHFDGAMFQPGPLAENSASTVTLLALYGL
jgi:hypothetical protein